MKKILVVEDDATSQVILEYDLILQGYEVVLCDNGAKALEILNKTHFDLLILDWMIPNLSGINLLKEIRKSNDLIKIIMVSAMSGELNIVQALESGADDYLLKPYSSRVLSARIKVLLKNQGKLSLLKINDDIALDQARFMLINNNEEIPLTNKEYKLLSYFVSNQNIMLNRDDILYHVYGEDYDEESRTLDVHIHSLKKKLKNDYIKSKRLVGYIFIN